MKTSWQRLWQKEIDLADKAIFHGSTQVFVGIYGSGKQLLIDEIRRQHINENICVFSFREMKLPTQVEAFRLIYHAIIKQFPKLNSVPAPQSDFEMHYLIREAAERCINKKLIIIIDECQHLLSMPDSFFDALESVRYRYRPNVCILIFSQPQIRFGKNLGLIRLLKNSIWYLPQFNLETTKQFLLDWSSSHKIDLSHQATKIQKMTSGHMGTIKYIAQQSCKEHVASVSSKKLIQWVSKDPMFPFFVEIVMGSLTAQERQLVEIYIRSGQLSQREMDSHEFDELRKLGIMRINRKSQPVFLVETYVPLAKEGLIHNETVPNTDALTINFFKGVEQKILDEMIKNSPHPLCFESIGLIMWPISLNEKFSLWAVQQVVSRIRKQLLRTGIPKTRIQTVRGVGYRWY